MAHGIALDMHLGEPESNGLLLRNRLIEGHSILGIRNAEFQNGSGHAQHDGTQGDPTVVHDLRNVDPCIPPEAIGRSDLNAL